MRKLLLLLCLLALAALPVAGAAAPLDEAQTALAEKDYASAQRILQPLVKSGDPTALYLMGVMSEQGLGMAKNPAAAFKYYTQAAKDNFAPAQNNLGMMYISGQGTGKPDMMKAVDLISRAAQQGFPNAQNNLGMLYATGTAVPSNPEAGASWVRKAAEMGLTDAQNNLGLFYLQGVGVNVIPAVARSWFQEAARQGHQGAMQNLEALDKAMQPQAQPQTAPAPSQP